MVVATQSPTDQDAVVDGAVRWLTERLPVSWTVGRAQHIISAAPMGSEVRLLDVAIDVRGSNGAVVALGVEARSSLEPRDVELLLSGLARSPRSLAGTIPLLVVAPWLSVRSRRALEAARVNFIDLSGNALIALENPTLYLRSDGAQRNPAPAARGEVRVRGPKAARLVRLLTDVRPPYGIRELASATGLAPGYVSQLVGALDREALVDRERRGGVHGADVAGLLRRWAESYELFATNATFPVLAAAGPVRALEALRGLPADQAVVVTGSFAAVRKAPVAAPALLCAYCRDPPRAAQELHFLPAGAGAGANVVLLAPFDDVVWQRAERDGGISYAAVSQVAVDCLTGNGRMPAEGEALLGWMLDNEDDWRVPSLAALSTDKR